MAWDKSKGITYAWAGCLKTNNARVLIVGSESSHLKTIIYQ